MSPKRKTRISEVGLVVEVLQNSRLLPGTTRGMNANSTPSMRLRWTFQQAFAGLCTTNLAPKPSVITVQPVSWFG